MIWFEHHMRWVLITPFGMPVEPDVNRNFAIVSGPTFSCASSTASVGIVAASRSNEVDFRAGSGLRLRTSSTSAGTTVSIAFAYCWPSQANTRPGVSRSKM